MTYNSKLAASRGKGYAYAIASKILDLLRDLRLNANDSVQRRWIWELLQNAKDVADIFGVSIEVNFQENGKEGFIEFNHDGKPFTIDDLTFLIQQVSTKDRKAKPGSSRKTTGKFGTGFITTHLLSEVVEVQSMLMEPGEPCVEFELLLDRSGRTKEEIIESVAKSLASLDDIDSQPIEEYSPFDFSTTFRYTLDSAGIEVARNGLKDLHNSLVFALVFLPDISSVKLVHENVKYELSVDVLKEGDDISIYTVVENTPGGKFESKIALLSKGTTYIAFEIEYNDGQIYLKEFNPLVPKLFCDFPLIGTESFPFPVIINSSGFNLNEPRNGIYLTDSPDQEVVENKQIILEAVDLYFTLLDYASQNKWGNIHLLAEVARIRERDLISKEWFNEVVKPIQEKLLRTPIVDTENAGRKSILGDGDSQNIWFPVAATKDIRLKIWDLANWWIPFKLPRRSDVETWQSIMWWNCGLLSLKTVTESIEKAGELGKLGKVIKHPTAWLNLYFKILDMDENLLNDVNRDKYSVIPNQKGFFIKKSEIKIDRNIEEELKNALAMIDTDPREYLLYKQVSTGQVLRFPVITQGRIIGEINNIIKQGNNEGMSKVCDYLVTLFSDDEEFPQKRESIYHFCRRIWPNDIGEKRKIVEWSEDIWQEVDEREIGWIAKAVSDCKDIQTFCESFGFHGYAEGIMWLNDFVSFLVDNEFGHLLNVKDAPLLPNQNGTFVVKDDVFLDDGDIDEELKDISAELGSDFRKDLLDVNIFLNLPASRTITQMEIAEEIVRLITPRFAEVPRSDETKEICKKLLRWFNGNKDTAAEYFGDIYLIYKHKLYDDDEIAENNRIAEEVSEIMHECGIADVSMLRQVLQAKQRPAVTEHEQITQDTLISLGVTSFDELKIALNDRDIASNFTHTSQPTLEMYIYAQRIIERAKNRVIAYLRTLGDYDCTDLEPLSNSSTVLGGIRKNGVPIHVVVRPSDNGKVIVYYGSERDVLDYANAELWIDDGMAEPRHLTLGRILKLAGINMIPLLLG